MAKEKKKINRLIVPVQIPNQITSDIIAKGIDDSILGAWLKAIMIFGCALAIILFLIFICSLFFNQHGESNMQVTAPAPLDKCNYKELSCTIIDYSHLEQCLPDSKCYKGVGNTHVCGWQEAYAWFNSFKNNYAIETKYDSNKLKLFCE